MSTRLFTALAIAGLAVCCSASGSDDDGDVVVIDDDGAGGGFGGGFNVTTGAGGGATDDCSDAARLIYLLTENQELYSFDPPQKQIALVGTLSCDTSMAPNSMAIDRDAVAWVNYVDGGLGIDSAGALYKVSTQDASCDPTPAVTLPAGWYRVGMGFSTDGSDTEEETLFVTSINSQAGLGRIDMATNTLVPIGSFTGAFAGQNAELTGTGDGGLFGFFTSSPVEVAALDKNTGAITSSTPLPSVESPTAWAFSFWGGDFYLYTAQTGFPSRVNQYRPSDGAVDTSYISSLGVRIVGAGVSTCAPLEPPK